MKKPKFPKTIYVKQEQDGDDWFLIAGSDPGAISESEGTIIVGKYKLEAEVKLINKTEVIKK